MPFDFIQGEILLINKPATWTSFDVVNNIRYFLKSHLGIKKIKIGHAGTLDPLATGLLILCTGKFTKKIEEFKSLDKEYTGVITLGATTPSFDLETEIDKKYETSHITEQMIRETALRFTGKQMQLPPRFSAVKIRGKRAYELARNEEEVVLEPKPVDIFGFEIIRVEMPAIRFRISCSKGTYIRAVARDFGKALQTGGYLGELCRTRVGSYHLRDSWELEDLKHTLLRG